MPSGTTQTLEEMDVSTLFNMPLADRLDWYQAKLNPYRSQVYNSATCHKIPPELLATTILNELGDINWQDTWQQTLGLNGSLGIAQIQVDTALAHGLLDFEPDDAMISQRAMTRCRSASLSGTQCIGDPDRFASTIRRNLVYHRLTIPEFAVEAAARRIAQILDQMTQHLTNPWQKNFNFTLSKIDSLSHPKQIYDFIDGRSQSDKEANLAEMVVAAYNSPEIVIAQQQASIDSSSVGFIYANGTIHGSNASFIARELHDSNLFH